MVPSQGLVKFIVATASVLSSVWCQAQWFADAGVEAALHENLTRSERAVDAREDLSLALTARGGIRLQPALYTGVTLSGSVRRTQFQRYQGLSNTEADMTVAVTHKFGLGDRQPALSATASIARNEYNVEVRDSWIYRAGIDLEKRLTDTLKLTFGLRYENRDGDHNLPRQTAFPRPGDSWDLTVRNLFVAAEQDLGPVTWLSVSYQFNDGDITSTSMSYPKIFNAATAITLDPVYGPLAVAYRLPARTHSLTLDFNRAMFASATAYLGIEFQRTFGRSGIDYDSTIVRGGFIHAF